MLLDAYASYEICNDADFRATRLSLLDRGYVFGIAHCRGGGEMGRAWYVQRLDPTSISISLSLSLSL